MHSESGVAVSAVSDAASGSARREDRSSLSQEVGFGARLSGEWALSDGKSYIIERTWDVGCSCIDG
jgi:hypothetical protein